MTKVTDIKRAQRASLLLKTISELYIEATRDDKDLAGLYISRVDLSQDKGICYVFFYTPEGVDYFKTRLKQLTLYKPSLRAALSKKVPGRYTPDIVFRFDIQQEKVNRLDNLFEQVKNDFIDDDHIKSKE